MRPRTLVRGAERGVAIALMTLTLAFQPSFAAGVREVAGVRAVATVPRIEVFTNSAIYLTNTQGATVYQLDGLQQLEEQLSQGLPGDQAQATAIASARMKAIGQARLQELTANAARGIVLAQQYGVDRAPAIVFDGRAVVYGMTDVAAATTFYLQHGGQR